MSTIRRSAIWLGTVLAWCRMKAGGKRYERWRRIRPGFEDDVGDNYRIVFAKKFRAKRNNRDVKRQCGDEQ